MEAATLPLPARRARRCIDGAASVAFVAALAVLASLALGLVGGYRALIERSDSMAPALRAGDVVVTKSGRARQASAGDIVSFAHPTREGILVTHRIVRTQEQGRRIAFVTRGDANTGVERWSIDANGTIGQLAWRIPKLGYAISWLALPAVRLLLVTAGALILGGALLRRIWS